MNPLFGRVVDEAEAGQLPVLVEELRGTDVGAAVRADLALLVARPELAMQCLIRRLGGAWDKPHWVALTRPVQDGVIEEYRTSARGRLWLTEHHVGIGDEVAWHRESGRRVQMVAPVAVRFDLDALPDELMIDGASLSYLDDDYAVLEFSRPDGWGASEAICVAKDVRTGEELWRDTSFKDVVMRVDDGILLYESAFGAITVVDRDGRKRRSNHVIGYEGAFTQTCVATREGHVVRVWDRIHARARRSMVPSDRIAIMRDRVIIDDGTVRGVSTGEVYEKIDPARYAVQDTVSTRELPIVDGVIEADGIATPFDDPRAVYADGILIGATTHYRLQR